MKKRIEKAIKYIETLLQTYDMNVSIDDQDLCHIIEILKGREQYMWYYLVRYSFDPDKHVVGPFDTENAAWSAAVNDAKREVKVSQEEADTNIDISIYEGCREITIIDHYVRGDDTTEYIVFEIQLGGIEI